VGEEKEVLYMGGEKKARALVYRCCYNNVQLENIKGCRYNGGIFLLYTNVIL
jgi:hypothetical protein